MSNPNGVSDSILILGDESKSVRAIERLLGAAGHNANATGSFKTAREYIQSGLVSLLIIELTAPRITGSLVQPEGDDSGNSLRKLVWAQEALRFCEQIRGSVDGVELPILVISKSHRAQDKVGCLNAGATDYVTRPYQRAELLSRVSSHLRSRYNDRERSRRFEQLNLLHEVSSVLTSSLEPELLLKGSLAVLIRYLNAEAGVVYLRNSETNEMSIVAAQGFPIRTEARYGSGGLYWMTAPLLMAKPLSLNLPPDYASMGLDQDVAMQLEGSILAALGLRENATGAICVFSRNRSCFPKQEEDLMATVCNQLSVALENARLFVETKRTAAQLSFVYNLGNNLMNSLEIDELLSYAVFAVGKSLGCDVCAAIVKNSTEPQKPASAIYAPSSDSKARLSDWFDVGKVVAYLQANEVTPQAALAMRVSEHFLTDPEIGLETVVPIVFDDNLLGILICASRSSKPLGADDQRLLSAVGQQLSLAIRNTELYRHTKDTSINLAVEVARRTREIEEQKRFTEKIIDSLPVSLYVIDRDMRIAAWNRNREIGGLGTNREEALGRNVFSVLTRQPRRVLEEEFMHVFRSGEMLRMEQDSWVDNQKKTWKISKIPMRVDNAEVTHVITVGEDITEQKKMNEAVIHAEKLASIGRLAAGVVHEINNPLATIAACAEALGARVDEMANQSLSRDFSEYLQIIRDEAFRCKAITNSLLEFSHQRQAEKHLCDVNQIIDQTLLLIKHHPKLGKIHIVKELDYSLTEVNVNEGQMKQIFIALISNAYDAMGGDGVLTIRTHATSPPPTVCVEFQDTGSGIPAADLPKIFDPFFTTKPLGRGTGLGLSVCYGIVSEHGGRIEVDSKEGKGATFRIMLPATQSEPAAATEIGDNVLEMEGAL
jgi:two-component system NtrC family sensor kinase